MIKLKKLMGEGADASKKTLSNEARRHFLEIISTYGSFGPKLKNENDLAQIAETLGAITDAASEFANKEAGNHFDESTVKRNMNELGKLSSQFEKIANEAKSLHSQMENLYEDMGHIIGRYYGVSELSEEEVSKRLGIRSEELVGNQHKLDLDKDGDIGSDDLAKLRAGKKTNESAIHEGTDIYNNNKVQITKFAGKNEQMIQINSARYNGSGDHIVMTNDEFIKMLKNSPKLLNQLK
jgi:hypothetical protein